MKKRLCTKKQIKNWAADDLTSPEGRKGLGLRRNNHMSKTTSLTCVVSQIEAREGEALTSRQISVALLFRLLDPLS
ncbi:hypothetical protein K2173_023436 [Erythroxylum novogranatense]|uniref:Uncharacterized protein n=1 Tax=Erythroxylum novogranatense TaxID=1862640 RepID=A0AAV8TVV8_9ROSI|nr:hypothetical protein K2173_023436 [Erythroxylum novogranatense]